MDLLTAILNQGKVPRSCPQVSLMEVIFSVEFLSFRVTILCCKTNQNTASSFAVLPDLKGSCINDFFSAEP